MPAAILYGRVSSEEQGKGYSVDTQLEQCRAYCEQRGYEVLDAVVDEYTGTEYERPGLDLLKERLDTGDVDVVVAWELDRLLGRDELGQVLIKHEILDHDVAIEYARDGSGHRPGSIDGELLTGVKQLLARQENADRTERSKRGKRGRIERGHPLVGGTGTSYGLEYISEPHKGHFTINEDEARIVREMFEWLVYEGLSTYAITQRLRDYGIPTRGDKRLAEGKRVKKNAGRAVWNPSTVRSILSNPVYKGQWIFGQTKRVKRKQRLKPDGTPYKTLYRQVKTDPSEWIIVDVPAIISEDLWERAQEQLAKNKNSTPAKRHEWLLQGMVFCVCGRPRHGNYYNTPGGGRNAYYRCQSGGPTQDWRGDCETRWGIRQELLEGAVWEYVSNYLLDPAQLRVDIERRREAESGERERFQQRLKAVDAEVAQIERRLSELLDRALDGFPAEIVEAKRVELTGQRERLITERKRLVAHAVETVMDENTEQALLDLSELVQRELPRLTFEQRRQLLRLLRLRVDVLDRERVKVSGLLSEDVVVTTSSGRYNHSPIVGWAFESAISLA